MANNDQNTDTSDEHPITTVANYFRNMYNSSDDSDADKKKKKKQVEQEASPSSAPPAQQALGNYFQNLQPRTK